MEAATIIRYDTLISLLLNPPPDPQDRDRSPPKKNDKNKKVKENSQELENLAILLSSH